MFDYLHSQDMTKDEVMRTMLSVPNDWGLPILPQPQERRNKLNFTFGKLINAFYLTPLIAFGSHRIWVAWLFWVFAVGF